MNYLLDKVIGNAQSLGSVHHFVWDRTRAIRNDFSIQQLTKVSDIRIAIECYEKIARFHILSLHQLALSTKPYDKYDWYQEREQLDRTLLSLMQYYDDSRTQIQSPHEAEFRAYCVIFQIQSPVPDLEDRVQCWPRHVLASMRVRKALDLYAAACNTADSQGPLKPRAQHVVAQANWEKFWSLLRSDQISYLMACVAEIYFNLVRKIALSAIWKAYRQGGNSKVEDWTLQDLVKTMGFDREEQVKDFCAHYGFTFDRRGDGKMFLDLTSVQGKVFPEPSAGIKEQIRSEKVVESKRRNRTLPAVIKGLSIQEAQRTGQIEKESAANDKHKVLDDEPLFVDQEQEEDPTLRDTPKGETTDNESLFVPEDTLNKESTISNQTRTSMNNDTEEGSAARSNPFQGMGARTEKEESPLFAQPNVKASIFSKGNDTSSKGTTSFGRPSGFASTAKPSQQSQNFASPFSSNFSEQKKLPSFATFTPPPPSSFGAPSTQILSGAEMNSTPPKFEFSQPTAGAGSFNQGASPLSPMPTFSAAGAIQPAKQPFNFASTGDNPAEHAKRNESTKIGEENNTSETAARNQTETKNSETAKFGFTKPSVAPDAKFNFLKSVTNANTQTQERVLPPSDSSFKAQKPSVTVAPTFNASPAISRQGFMKEENSNFSVSKGIKSDPNLEPTSDKRKNTQKPESTTNSPAKILQNREEVLNKLTKHILLDPTTGFLTQYIEYAITPLINGAIEQVAQERLLRRAMDFRQNVLATRYGTAWKEITWHLRLARQGRKRRAKIAKAREEKARNLERNMDGVVRDLGGVVARARQRDVKDLGESKVAETKASKKEFWKDNEYAEDAQEDDLMEDLEEIEDRDDYSLTRPKTQPSRFHVNSTQETNYNTPSRSKGFSNPHASSQSNNTFPTTTPSNPYNTFTDSTSQLLGAGQHQRSTTKTNYFRLKAMGIQPVGQNTWDRPRDPPPLIPSTTTTTTTAPSTRTTTAATSPTRETIPAPGRTGRQVRAARKTSSAMSMYSSSSSSSSANTAASASTSAAHRRLLSKKLAAKLSAASLMDGKYGRRDDDDGNNDTYDINNNNSNNWRGRSGYSPLGDMYGNGSAVLPQQRTALLTAAATAAAPDTTGQFRGIKRKKSRATEIAEQEDDELFARVRAAKEALQESIAFYREEMGGMGGDAGAAVAAAGANANHSGPSIAFFGNNHDAGYFQSKNNNDDGGANRRSRSDGMSYIPT